MEVQSPGHPEESVRRGIVERVQNGMVPVWMGWFAVYFGTGVWAQAHDSTSYLAATVDHVETFWVAVVFLNMPLQIGLAIVSISLSRVNSLAARRASFGVGAVLSVLIVAHLALTFAKA